MPKLTTKQPLPLLDCMKPDGDEACPAYRALADGLTERGRSVARLIAENASLRERIEDRPIDEMLAAELNRIKPIMREQAAEIERLDARNVELLDMLRELVNPEDFDQHPNDFMPVWHKARAILAQAASTEVNR